MKSGSADKSFYQAVFSVHQNLFINAHAHIAKARDSLDHRTLSLSGDGYGRTYKCDFSLQYKLPLTMQSLIVRAQMLSELEEVIMYKQASDKPERQKVIRKTWMRRLLGMQSDVEVRRLRLIHHIMRQNVCPQVWMRILQVRALAIKPEEEPVMWTKFANLCRKSNRIGLAEQAIRSLLPREKGSSSRHHIFKQAPPRVYVFHWLSIHESHES